MMWLCVCCMFLLDAEDVSIEMNNLQLELSSLIDLDDTTALNDRYSISCHHYYLLIVCIIRNSMMNELVSVTCIGSVDESRQGTLSIKILSPVTIH